MKDFDEWKKTASKEQINHLMKIVALAQQEKEIDKRIEAVFATTEEEGGSGVLSTNEGITVCETADDARVITAKDRKRKNAIREKIAKLLQEAVADYQMQDLGIIARSYESYVGEPVPSQAE